jgi:CHAT domain-containing protein
MENKTMITKKGGLIMSGKFVKDKVNPIIVLILLFFFSAFVLGQEKQADENRQLREEILDVYKSDGEQGLRDFMEKQKDKISNKFIVDFAQAGVKERKEEWLNVCEIMAEEKKDEKTLADVLYKIGDYFSLISDNKKALEYFDKSLHLYINLNDPVGQGYVYFNKALILHHTGNKSEALELYEKALVLFKKAGDDDGQGNVYLGKGDTYLSIGKNSKAFEFYEKALPFFENTGTALGLGHVYKGKGDIHYRTGNNLKALEFYEKALPLYEKAGAYMSQGNIYLKKGEISFRIGENEKAFEMFDKALLFYENVNATIGKGNVYWRKGLMYLRIGDNLKALEMYDKAQLFFEKAGQLVGQGNVYSAKGEIYLRMGDKSKGLVLYDKALYFFEKAGQYVGQGKVYFAKGVIYLSIGENSKVIDMLDKALSFFEKARYPIGLGNVYQKKGEIYFTNGENARAFEMFDKAMFFFEKSGWTLGQAHIYMGKGDIYIQNGDYTKALEMCNKAISLYKKTGEIETESSSLLVKAKVLLKLGKNKEVLDIFEKGISKLERVRVQTAFSKMKRTFMEKIYWQYKETVLFMLENKYNKKGFRYAESMKSRVFLDQLAEEFLRLDKGLKPDLKEKRDDLVTNLSSLSKQINDAAGGKDEKKLRELKKQYSKKEDEFDELLMKIRLENPMYASVRYPQPVTVQELQKEVLKKGESLVRYFISADKLYVFLVSKKKFKVVSLEIKKEEINSVTERYLVAIKENNYRDMNRFGSTLYKRLIKPLEKSLEKNKDIIIIPDGQLAVIPFESLIMDKNESEQPVFLLEKYRIKYIQSASILSVLRKHYQRDRETQNFIGFGDPVYDYKKFKQEKIEQAALTQQTPKIGDEIKEMYRSRYARAGGILPRLQGSGEEVKTIARLFEKKLQKCAAQIRDKATEENAKVPEMKDFDYIHFACHGLLNDDFQCLVLSQDIPGAKDDGYFTLNEIMNCDYNAKLVVLSGCETGSGKMERAEGVTGLTRAVMYAGTPAVMASLWKVDDNATKELMINFYKNMLEKNLDKTEALRQAKLQLLKSPQYSSPLFWSAFVLYGE